MIISASYKTDIPTFYADWFMNRLRAGYCKVVNAFNRRQIRTISLRRGDVDGFVFWTKNAKPFERALRLVRERGLPFVVQYTINAYPRVLESRVVDWASSVETFRQLADEHGPRALVWRYDTIVLTDQTPADVHRTRFAEIARALTGSTDEVVISFVHPYRKTTSNMRDAAKERGLHWWLPSEVERRDLVRDLVSLAEERGMKLTVCSQPENQFAIASAAACIDARRLGDVAGHPLVARTQGNRPGCECSASVDIGEYDTCPHGCIYCYAVRRRQVATDHYQQHNPDSEFLFDPDAGRTSDSPAKQLGLFDGEE